MKALFLLMFLALFSGAVHAAGYGAAGCGLGSLVFETKNGRGNQILAMTTNGFFGSQIFGISSGTSNCDAQGLFAESKVQQTFVAANFDVLTQEMATGKGEHLVTLGQILGCQDIPAFSTLMNAEFKTIGSAETPDAMLLNVKKVAESHAELNCSLL